MPSAGISGVAVAAGTGGLFLIYIGVEDVGIRDGLRSVISGKLPTPGPGVDVGGGALGAAVGEVAAESDAAGIGAAVGGAVDGAGNTVGDLQAYAKQLLAQRGWSAQWGSFNSLVMGESGWSWNAVNPGSHGYNGENHAYGIAQALPPGKMISAGTDWKTNGKTQLRWMMQYIASSYGNPNNAYMKWLSRSPHWY